MFRKEFEISKNIIDDGFNSGLVEMAKFDGIHEIPILDWPKEIIIPAGLIPFSQRRKSEDMSEFVHFYEHDLTFRDVLVSTEEYVDDLKCFAGIITPDCSLYRDMPLVLQFVNVYMSRAIGHYFQQQGMYVIPNVRWGDERTYTSEACGEKVAFLGIPKQSIVSIGTYGCIKSAEDKYYFKAGLEAMLEELAPRVVLVYGAMPDSVFGGLTSYTEFHQYPDWISQRRRKAT